MVIDMAKNKVPDYCKDCAMLWTHGVKDGKHDRHCCHFGKPAPKVWKHCKENGGKVPNAKVTGAGGFIACVRVERRVMP